MNLIRTLLREPLLHFAILGGLLFLGYSILNPEGSAETAPTDDAISITSNEVARMQAAWVAQQQRPLSETELHEQLVAYLEDRLLEQEARNLGLDENDVVIRRRLSDRMRLLLEETARLVEPSENDLKALYERDPHRFDDPAFVSFKQVYFSQETRGAEGKAAASQVLSELQSGVATSDPGDSALFPRAYVKAPKAALIDQFGEIFADSVFAGATNVWQGPFESTLGFHLVFITDKRPTRTRSFEEARESVRELWSDAKIRQARKDKLTELIQRHDLQVDEAIQPLFEGVTEDLLR